MSRSSTSLSNKCPCHPLPLCQRTKIPIHLNGSTLHRQVSAKMAAAQILKSKGIFKTATHITPNLIGTKRNVPLKKSTGGVH